MHSFDDARITATEVLCQLALFKPEYTFDDDLVRENFPQAEQVVLRSGHETDAPYLAIHTGLCRSPQLSKRKSQLPHHHLIAINSDISCGDDV
jgi:hypothetical protein